MRVVSLRRSRGSHQRLSSSLIIKELRSIRIENDRQVPKGQPLHNLAQSTIALLGLRVPNDEATGGGRGV